MTNLWKRSISMFLALVMVIGMLPTSVFATETEPVETTSVTETTVPETEAPAVETTEAPTEPETEPEETTLPAETEETLTEPSEEPLPVVSKETYTATETAVAEEETVLEESVPEETKAPVTKHSYKAVPDVELPDENELLAGYLDQQFFGKEASALGTAAGNRLTGDTKLMYDALVGVIQEIAAGDRTSAIVSLGYDLGEVNYDDGTSEEVYADIDVNFTGADLEQDQIDLLLDALLADLPYEQYWFDKVTGYSVSWLTGDTLLWVEFSFAVADNYQGADDYSVDTGLTGAAADAAANAKTVVGDVAEDVAAMTDVDADYETLRAYKDWICETVSYNHDAVAKDNFSEESDPWQLIYVFDDDSTTNVVCEGYSKAFQYLCDLTTFVDEDALCYSVTGDMGTEGHMWNIMELNGGRYLVDVTNSDAGTIGASGGLFLVGGNANADGSYSFAGTTFTYDEDTQSLWGDDGVLTLSTTNYEPVVEEEPAPSDELTQAEFVAEITGAAGTNHKLSKSVTLTESLTINMATADVPNDVSLNIPSGVTLTIPSGVTLTMETNLILNGGSIVIKDGGTLVLGSANVTTPMYLWGGTLTIESGAVLNTDHGAIIDNFSFNTTVNGTLPTAKLFGQANVSTQDELKDALNATGYQGVDVYIQSDLTLTEDLTIAQNQFVGIFGYTLTVASGVTLTNEGILNIGGGSVLVNNGTVISYGDYINDGTLIGNAVVEQIKEISQADFESAVAAAAANGDVYYLTGKVTLTSDMTIPANAEIYITNDGMLLVPSGVELTNEGYIQLDGGKCIIEGGITSTGRIQINSGIMYFGTNATNNISNMNGPIVDARDGDTETKLVLYNLIDNGSTVTANWNSCSTSDSVVPGMFRNGLFCIREWDGTNYGWINTPVAPADLTVGNYLTVLAMEDTDNPPGFITGDTNASNYVAIIAEEDQWDKDTSVSYVYNGTTYEYKLRLERFQNHGFYSQASATNENWLGFGYTIDPDKEENAFYYIFTDSTGWSINHNADVPFAVMDNPFDRNAVEEVSWEKISDTIYKITIDQDVVTELCANGGSFPVHVEVAIINTNGVTGQWGIGQIWCRAEQQSAVMTQAEFEAELAANAGTNYVMSKSVTITEDMTISMATDAVPYDHSVMVPAGVTLTVANGATLTVETNLLVDEGAIIVEDGGKLVVGTEDNRAMMYLWGGTLDVANESGLDLTHSRLTVEYGADNVMPDWITTDSINAQAYIRENSQLQTMLAIKDYAFIDIYVTCDLTVTEDITISENQWLGLQPDYSMTVNEGVIVTVEDGGSLFVAENSVINNNGRILCYGQYNNYGTLNGNAVELVIAEMTEAEFVEAMANAENNFLRLEKNLTITGAVEIPSGTVVYVDDIATLTVAEGGTLTVNGQLSTNNGKITVNGILVNNGWMHTDSNPDNGSACIRINSTGEFRNNSGFFLGNGKLIVEGTYTLGEEGYISVDDTATAIEGFDKVSERIELQIIARSEEELRAAMEAREGYAYHKVYMDEDVTLTSDLTVPEGVSLYLCYSWMDEGDYKTLTVPENVTLTVDGQMGISDHGELVLESGSKLVNNGTVNVSGRIVNNGTIEGNMPQLYGDGVIEGDGEIVTSEMTQAEFEEAMLAADEYYYLNANVTLTEDMNIVGEVRVGPNATLTVDGCMLSVGFENGFSHLICDGGTVNVLSNAALDIWSNAIVEVRNGGTLNIEDGADTTGVWAGGVWIDLTEEGQNTVNGLEDAMLSARYYPVDAAGLEAAFATSDTYAIVYTFPTGDVFELDRDITVPEDCVLNLNQGGTLRVPTGYTLTNDGSILITAENRLEVLEGGALVNNGEILVNQYGQLYYYKGTLTNNGTIEGDGDIVSNEMSHQALMDALEECEANGSSWVHESETTLETTVNEGILEISMGSGDPAPAFYLAEGGILRVPSGTTLKVYNPLILIGGQVIVEAGGTLDAGNGHMEVRSGTIYAEEGATVIDNGHIQGKVTWEGNTETYLSGRWLDNWEEGWFENTASVPDENAGRGCRTMGSAYVIFYLKIWDSENLCWNTIPVLPTASSTGNYSITKLQNTDETIKADEANAEYFVRVDVGGTLDHRDDTIYVNYNGQSYTFDYALWSCDLAFYTSPEDSVDTIIANHEFVLDTSEGAENAIYLIQRDERTLSDVTWTINSHGEDYNTLVSDGAFLTYEEITEGKVWKITVDPEFVDYIRYDWKNFELRYNATVTDSEGNEETRDDGIWINPPELLEPAANLRIDNSNYLIYETGAVFQDYFTGEYDDNGYEIWERKRTALPDGVSYVLDENKIILDGVSLTRLELFYYESGTDPEGNFWENYGLPSENVTISLVGSSTISNTDECAFVISRGANVTFTGNGSLHLKAANSPENVNDEGNRYAYPTVVLADGGNMTVAGNATVTAEVAGSGFHGEQPAQMEAINGHGTGTLTLSSSATLNIVTPEGTRTLDESQENYGGARGIVGTNIVVSDSATLNTGSIYLWEGVDFTMNGGTVNLDPIGEVFFSNRWQDWLLSNLGIYLEHEDSVFTMNDGTINMDLSPNEDADIDFTYTTFQGINAALGDVIINGGEININSDSGDGGDISLGGETVASGNGIAIQCAWNEEGPDATKPASSLTITGGTVNVYPVGQEEYEGIYLAPLATAELSGGSVYADDGAHYLEGDVAWNGDVQLTGDVHIFDGSRITVEDGGSMTITHETKVYEGAQIVVENGGSLHVSGHLTVKGTVFIRNGGSFTTDEGEHVTGEITWEGNTDPYLTSTWLDNYNGEGWYMNDEFHRTDGLMAMEDHWRIFFLNTWDETNLVWNSEPVIPTVSSQYMTITPVADTDNPTIREDQDPAYSEFFVCVSAFGTLDEQTVTLNANGCTIPFKIHARSAGFFRTTDFTMENYIEGHGFTVDPAAEENVLYWLVRDPANYDVVSMDVSYNPWNNEDYSDFTGGDDLAVMTDEGDGVYKFVIDPDFVDYVQYDYKNFEIRVDMILDYNGDEELHEEPCSNGMWINPPELKKPAAAIGIDGSNYLIFDTGAIFRDVCTGYDDWGYEIWERERAELPNGVAYNLDNNQLMLTGGAELTSLELAPYGSGENEDGSTWEVFGLPNENFTFTVYGENTIINNANSALRLDHGLNTTINGTGSLYVKTTNYTDIGTAFNTVQLSEGSTLTIGGDVTVTAELSGHGYWDNGEAATCHAISGGYNGETLEITDNATLTTVLPYGVRRYDGTGTLSQVGGYVGIQNFNAITVSGGTLNTDHLNFYNGGEFNLESGVVNIRDTGVMHYRDENGTIEYHYEGIQIWNGNINISGGELNIDASPIGLPGETDSTNFTSFYGINGIYSAINISGGTVNITGGPSDGWAILADCQWTEEGLVEGTGSCIYVTGGTINVNAAEHTYHGGILVSETCEGYFFGGEINDDYGIHRFYGNTVWGDSENGGGTVLSGAAAGVYTHGPGEFKMYDGQINLTGDVNEATGEQNRGHIMINGGAAVYGGQINLTNGTLINKMNIGIEGGELIVVNDWEDVPGIENYLYLPVVSGTIDITTNGTAIQNPGTFHQMGGQVIALNTETAEHPVIHSAGSILLNDGYMDLSGGYYGIVQNYDFEAAAEGNESMLFAGAMEEGQCPTLNISGSKMGIYASAPVVFPWNANVNIYAEGTPTDNGRDWPIAILIDELIDESSNENVSYLSVGGSVLNLSATDTAGVDLTSKGIVAWNSPVYIEDFVDEETGEVIASPDVTIDAEVAIYSVSDSLENTNFDESVAFFNEFGESVSLESQALSESEYLHTLTGWATTGVSSVMSLADFLAAVEAANANGELYSLTETVIVDQDAVLNGGVIIDDGGRILVQDGAVLTNTQEIQVMQGGSLAVEAGGRLLNQGAFLIWGAVSISDDGDYAGYVRDTHFYAARYAYGTKLAKVTGISESDMILYGYCDTEDEINYILGIHDGYFETFIEVSDCSVALHTMTIPDDVYLNSAGAEITVLEDNFLTINGGMSVRSGILTIDGKLIVNNTVSFSYAQVDVNGTLENNGNINAVDDSVLIVNGTLDNYGDLNLGYIDIYNEEQDAMEQVADFATLRIAESGTLNNYGTLRTAPQGYDAEEERTLGGVVFVDGTLNNLSSVDSDGIPQLSYIEQYGDLTVSGVLNNEGILNVKGIAVVDGTIINKNTISIIAELHLYGTVENNGSIRLDGNRSKLTTYEGATLVNNMSISNRVKGAVVTLAEGTYSCIDTAELVQTYYDDGSLTEINGAPEGTLSILYEGGNVETMQTVSEMVSQSEGYYQRCFLRVVEDVTIPADMELNLNPESYLVVMNDGENYTGSLTLEGTIYNQGTIRLFAADMTIAESGYLWNGGTFESMGDSYGNTETRTLTVAGFLDNAYVGTLSLNKTACTLSDGGVIQNTMVGDQLGTITGIAISDQTLRTDVDEGTQAQLQELISMVQNDGYRDAYLWVSKDLHITSDMVIPGNVHVGVQNGYTLTIDSGVVLQLDSSITVDEGGKLDIYGALGVGGTVDVSGCMHVETYGSVGLGTEAVVNILESGELIIDGYAHFGVDGGTLNVLGTYDSYGTISVTWTESHVGETNNVDLSEATLWMPINATFPGHDETDMTNMLYYAQEKGFGFTQVLIVNDYTFANDFTIPENMTISIGTYRDETTYSGTVVTIPAGKTLTVNGHLEIANGSKLVIEEGATLTHAGTTMDVYGTLENNGTLHVDAGNVYINNENSYVHGGNAKVYLEAFDEDYATINGMDLNLITLVYRGTDEEQLLSFFDTMKYDGYSKGEAYIDGPMTMTTDWYVEPYDWEAVDNFDVDVYISGANAVLTVPEVYDTLGTNASIYVQDGGRVNVTGAMFIHADMLIMDGGIVTVNGTMGCGTIYVYEGGQLIVNGNWDGYNPINYGGTIEGECFRLTQDKLEQLMAEDHSRVIMRNSLELDRDMTIEKELVVAGEGYVLTVPEGVTLTVNGYLQVNLGAKLDIQGTLVNNGTVCISGEGSQLVNTGTVNDYSAGIFTLMDGQIINNGIWNTLSGTCGENAKWALRDGVLTISGSGDMLDYTQESAPWSAYGDQITSVKIGSGITKIGAYAFRDVAAESILVPRTVAAIGENAFAENVTLKVYHNSVADTYATDNGYTPTYIHEMDPETGKCVVCDYSVNDLQDKLADTNATAEEKVEEVKNTDTESLKNQIETEMESSDTGTSDTMDLIEDLETEVKTETGIEVTTEVEATDPVVQKSFASVSEEAIVGAVLNADEGVSEVKLVISDAESTTTEDLDSETYDTESAVLFSMTLEGVEDTENLDVPVKITLPVPEGIDTSKMKILHYHNGTTEELAYTLSTDANGSQVVTFVLSSFSDFAIVEEASVEEEIQKINLSGTAMTLGNSLSMDFAVNVANLVDNGAGHYAIITKHYADGREDVITRVEREDWALFSGSLYTASCNGIAAKEMCDEVDVVFYNADGIAVTNTYTDSVKSYAMRTLNNPNNQSKTELLICFVDMLNYGAAAQTLFGYDTENPANADLTEAQRAMATTEINPSDARVKGPGYAGSALTLESQILLDFVFYDSTIGTDYTGMYAIASYTDHYGNAKEIRLDEFKLYSSGLHYVSVSGMAVADCSQVVSCTIYNSDGDAIASASDSVEGYVARQLASGRLDDLYPAILKFAASAYNYFH